MKNCLPEILFCLSTFFSLAVYTAANAAPATQIATFAGGCFWCMQPPFDKLDGVISTTSGYTGGHVKNPKYKEVSSGITGHAEAIQIVYAPQKISYQKLLEIFWHNIDPLDPGGQFCDRGKQYRSEIFYHNETQKQLAIESKAALLEKGPFAGKILATSITEATAFYPAENYHQNYYKKNPIRYQYYRYRCGRDEILESYWPPAATVEKNKHRLQKTIQNK